MSPAPGLPMPFARQSFLAIMLCLMAVLPVDVAQAEPLALPTGPVILTVTGQIATTNAEGRAEFDLPMLLALGEVTVTTTTHWTDGVQVFTGVPLERVIARVGAGGATIFARALNDYAVEIPMADAVPGGAVVAYAQNGMPLSPRHNGPLWVIYPFDDNPAYRTEVTYTRSIWHLLSLEVRP